MTFMEASDKNFKICEEIIELLHKNNISIAQSYAILEKVKVKITQDTSVGELIPFPKEKESTLNELRKQHGLQPIPEGDVILTTKEQKAVKN